MKIRTVISPTERGLMIRDKAIVDILAPGVYWHAPGFDFSRIEVVSIVDAQCSYPQIETLVKVNPELAERCFTIANLSDTDVGVVYQDGKLTDLLAPGSLVMYWKGLVDTVVNSIDTSEVLEVDEKLTRAIGRTGRLAKRAAEIGAVLGVVCADPKARLFAAAL